jgi:PAS domain S-box-containing protein
MTAARHDLWAETELSRALFEQSPLSTVIYDPQGHLLAVNPAFRALWGVGLDTAPPGYSILTDPELERQGALPLVRRAFEGEPVTLPPVRYDISALSTDGQGSTRWSQAHLFPVRRPDGGVSQVVLTHVDLTAVMEAEEALRASEERFRGAQEQSPDGFAVLRPVRGEDGRVVDFAWEYANPAALRTYGATLQEVRGERLLARNPGTLPLGIFDAYVRTAETGEPFETEVQYRHEQHDTWFRITAVRLGGGIAVTFSDVGSRYRAQERGRSLLALAAALGEASTPEQVAAVIFRETLAALRADGGSLGVVRTVEGGSGMEVEMLRSKGYAPAAVSLYRRFPVVPGRPLSDAILSGHPVLLGSREAWEARYPGQYAANIEPLGYEAYAGLPVLVGDRPVAGVSFSFVGPRTFDDETATFLETIGRLCAQALERARSFEAERRALARSRTVLESVRDGFIALDARFRYTFVNEHAAELLGRPAEELLGRSVWEVFPEAEHAFFGEMVRETLRERRVVTKEDYSRSLRRWVYVRAYPADDGLVVFMQDVTERRRSQDASGFLAEASRVLASSLEYEATLAALAAAAVPVLGDWCAVDMLADPTADEWPPRLERLAVVHQDPEKVEWARRMEGEQRPDWGAATGLPRVLREGVTEFYPMVTDEMVVASAKSLEELERVRALQISAVIIVPLIARGRTLGALTLVMAESGRHYDDADLRLAEDLAQRAAVAVDNARLYREAERARLEAEAANRAKSDFLATMSHELRTPLNAIGGYTELMAMELRGPLTAHQRDDLERIRRSQAHLLALINAVLNFARLEAGHVTFEPADFRVDALVRETVELMEPQARARSLALTPGEGCELVAHADADKVRQVVLNLLSNALKFTPAGGEVSVWCEPVEDGRRAAIHVRDTGIGIAAEQLDPVFDPFVQVGRSLSAPTEGAGLGLAISRDLARAMGGELTVRSAPSAGSTFTLTLPVSVPTPVPA